MFAALLALDYHQGPDPLSVDAYLERRITWWHWIAEVGTHSPGVGPGVRRVHAAYGQPHAAQPPRQPPTPIV